MSTRPSARVIDSPRCSAPRSGPNGIAERVGGLDVEPARAGRPRRARSRPRRRRGAPGRRGSGSRRARAPPRRAPRRARAGRELPEDAPQAAEEVAQARRPVDGQRQLALAQLERLQHPGQAEVVVGVEVREEDLLEIGQPDRRAHQLPLGSFAAVEEQPVAAAAHEQRRRRARWPSARCRTCRGRRGRGPRAPIVASAAAAADRRATGSTSVCPARTSALAQVVRPLDPPDRVADVAAVVALRDRPERVVRPHRHHLLRAVRLGGARDGAPDENGDPYDEKILTNMCSPC